MPRKKKHSQPSPSPNNSCKYCHLKLSRCSKCKNVSYCSVDCQQKDWANHKKDCKTQISEKQSPVPVLPNKKESCNRCGVSDVKLSKCSQCHEVKYCSKECQKIDWLEHKADCKKKAELFSAISQTSQKKGKSEISSGAPQTSQESCNRCGVSDVELSKCSQCHEVKYCSKECQKTDWLKHKADCKKKAELFSAVSQTSHKERKSEISSGAPQTSKTCNRCGVSDVKLSKCSQCHEVKYCSKECQKIDWLEHKADCKKKAELFSAISQTSQKKGKSEISSGAPQTSQESCNRCGVSDVKLSKCSQCHEVKYCSKECQKIDWLEHKADCKKKAELFSAISQTSQKKGKSEISSGAPQTSQESCNHCGLSDVKLSKCSRCQEVKYCSKECQKTDWLEHKADCKKKAKRFSGISQTTNSKCRDCFNIKKDDCEYCENCLRLKIIETQFHPCKISDNVWRFAKLRYPAFQIITFYSEVSIFFPYSQVLLLLMSSFGDHPFRPSMFVSDEAGYVRNLIFYLEYADYSTFWYDFQPGNYICLKCPVFHLFLDGTEGFRIESLSNVSIIKKF